MRAIVGGKESTQSGDCVYVIEPVQIGNWVVFVAKDSVSGEIAYYSNAFDGEGPWIWNTLDEAKRSIRLWR